LQTIFITLTGIIVLLSLFLGIKVYNAGKAERVNRSFGLFTIIFSIWIIFDFLAYQISLTGHQLLINRIVFADIILLVLFLTWFVHIFPRSIFEVPKILKYLIIAWTVLIVFLALFTDKIVKSVSIESWGSNVITGDYFFVFVIYVSLLAIIPIVVLITKLIKFNDLEKKQIKYILYGIATLTIFNLLFNLLIPSITKNFEFARFGTYSAIFFVAFTAYAILKTHLFNLRIILTETAAVIIDVILAVQVFTSHSVLEALLRALLAILVYYGSYLLVKSVREEIKRREELQELSDELKIANQKLQAIDAMKTEFVSMASHELLTPISAIEGYLSMMLDEKMVKIDDPKAIEYMNRVYKSAKRLARLVADLLNVSRIEEGRLLVEKQDIELEETITSVINELKFKAEGAKVSLESEISDEAKVKVYADPDKIKEVIINLVGNSIKYSHEGGHVKVKAGFLPIAEILESVKTMENICAEENKDVSGEGSIHSAIHEKYREPVGDRQLVISVQDDGVGIEKCDVGRLFKKFSRVGDWSTQETPGTGLGLYISRSLVEMHHGRIWAESDGKDKGSTFCFSLPLFETKEQVVKLDGEVPKAKDAKPLAKSAVGN